MTFKMKTAVFLFGSVGLLVFNSSNYVGLTPWGERKGTLIYKIKDHLSVEARSQLDQTLDSYQLRTIRSFFGGRIKQAVTYSHWGLREEEMIQGLLKTHAVEFVERDYLLAPAGFDTSYLSDLKSGIDFDSRVEPLPRAQEYFGSVPVGICDTGADLNHDLLKDQLRLPGYNTVNGTSDVSDVAGHGTRIAGSVLLRQTNSNRLARVEGIEIIPVKISMRADGWAHISDVMDCLDWLTRLGVRVLNLSYDVGFSASIRAAGELLRSEDRILIVSSGNGGRLLSEVMPSSAIGSVLIVGAYDKYGRRPFWSNYGNEVALSHAAVDIVTPVLGGGVALSSGTSIAAAKVSQKVAFVLSTLPQIHLEKAVELAKSLTW